MGAWRSIRAAGVRIVAGGAGSRWRARMLRTTSDHLIVGLEPQPGREEALADESDLVLDLALLPA
jgi:hypothetical protein